MDKFLIKTSIALTVIFIITAIGINKFAKNHTSNESIAIDSTIQTTISHPQLNSDTSGLFAPMPEAKPGDWLDCHEEKGQTFKQFLKQKRNIPDEKRGIIYLQPMWMSDTCSSPSLQKLKRFTETYFMMPVIVAKSLNPPKEDFERRINPLSQNEQVHAGIILEYLMKHVPKDAFCVQAITTTDLYPDPAWNFVFGYASYLDRVGVFSFARYNPLPDSKKLPKYYEKLLLLRCCKIIGHETGHMFRMAHCIFYKCQMNGSNHLQESDSQPIHLCPVCLPKLQNSIKFDQTKRYKQLLEVYQDAGFAKEAVWVEKRLSIKQR